MPKRKAQDTPDSADHQDIIGSIDHGAKYQKTETGLRKPMPGEVVVDKELELYVEAMTKLLDDIPGGTEENPLDVEDESMQDVPELYYSCTGVAKLRLHLAKAFWHDFYVRKALVQYVNPEGTHYREQLPPKLHDEVMKSLEKGNSSHGEIKRWLQTGSEEEEQKEKKAGCAKKK